MNYTPLNDITDTDNIIFCFVARRIWEHDVSAIALTDDGCTVSGHVSIDHEWAQHDMNHYTKHVKYATHFPFGYKIVWIDDWTTCDHPIFLKAKAIALQGDTP